MKRSSVRLSVSVSVPSFDRGGFAAQCRAGERYRSTAAAAWRSVAAAPQHGSAGSATVSAYVGSGRQTCLGYVRYIGRILSWVSQSRLPTARWQVAACVHEVAAAAACENIGIMPRPI